MGTKRWKADPSASQEAVDRWMVPFQRAIGVNPTAAPDDLPSLDEFQCANLRTSKVGSFRFLIARMGRVTCTRVYDLGWKPVQLPGEFDWNSPWDPDFHRLPSGLYLVDCGSIESIGIAVGVRLVWLRPEERRLAKVGTFTSGSTLDYETPVIRGNRVTMQTQDDPVTFTGYPSELLFRRVTTWDVSGSRPQIVKIVRDEPELRFLDREMIAAVHARKRSAFQRKLLKLCGPVTGPNIVNWVDDWKVVILPGGVHRLFFNGTVCDLEKRQAGYVFKRISAVKPAVIDKLRKTNLWATYHP